MIRELDVPSPWTGIYRKQAPIICPGKLGHLKVTNAEEDVTCWCGGKNCLSAFISRDFLEAKFNLPYEEALRLIRKGEPSGFYRKILSYIAPILGNVTVLLGIEKIYAFGRMVDIFGNTFIQDIALEMTPLLPSWINFMGIEKAAIPSFPEQCSAYFMDYFLKNILTYLETVEETPFRVR